MSTPETDDPSRELVVRDQADPRRSDPRLRDQRPRPADLPDHVVHLRQHRARRRPVRPGRAGQHLHPDHEPDPGRRRAAHRRARGRRRRAVPVLRAGRGDVRHPEPRRRGRSHRVQPAALRRHLQPVPLHAAQARHRDHLRRRPRRPGLLAGGGAAEHQGVLRRDHLQPADRHPGHPGRLRGRPRQRCAADRRQHHRHAVPDPADRPGRRHRRALGHQVPRRARHGDRRRDRRRRHLRLDAGPVPRLHHPGPQLPRRGVRRARTARVRAQGPRAAAARPRFGGVAVQRLPGGPGPGDAEPADRAARRQRATRRRIPGRPRRRGVGQLRGAAQLAVVRARQRSWRPREPARCWRSSWPAASRPARRSSTR